MVDLLSIGEKGNRNLGVAGILRGVLKCSGKFNLSAVLISALKER